MSTIFIRHQVTDFDSWKEGFDEHGRVRREYGLVDAGLYRGAEDPNDVTIALTTEDAPRAQEFLASDELKEAMTRVGVVAAPEVWITEEV